jgi:hypothetical protein
MVEFSVLAIGVARLWPDFAIHAYQWMRERVFTFTAPMAFCNLVLWVLAEIGAGWVAGRISRRNEAVWVLAGLAGIYLAVLHFALYWPRFPWWYNLGVVVPAVPALLLGAKLASSSRSAVGTRA